MFVKVFEVRAERHRFELPIGKTKQGTDADAAKSTLVRALGTIEAPVEIFLRPGGVQRLINLAIVSLLIHDQPFRSVRDDLGILIVLHRADLDAERGNERLERIETVLQIAIGNKLRMLASNEQQVAKTKPMQVPRLAHDLLNGQRRAQDFRIARKAAIAAVVHAFVGKIQRRKQTHGFAKVPTCDLLALPRQGLKPVSALVRKHPLEAPHQRCRALEKLRKHIGKGHHCEDARPATRRQRRTGKICSMVETKFFHQPITLPLHPFRIYRFPRELAPHLRHDR